MWNLKPNEGRITLCGVKKLELFSNLSSILDLQFMSLLSRAVYKIERTYNTVRF